MRDLSKSLLAYRVGDYSLRTSYKSSTSTLSISFDFGQRKRPLVKAQAKTKSPLLPPPVAALKLAPLESRGEEPFRSPEGTGHGRKKRKRREIPSPGTPPRPIPTQTKATETQTSKAPAKTTETQTATTPGPSLNTSQVQTDPVQEPVVEEDIRVELTQQASLILEQHKVHPNPCYQNEIGKVYPSNRPRPPMVMVQYLGQERFEHEIHSNQDLSDFLVDCGFQVSSIFVTNVAARRRCSKLSLQESSA